jgi:hypothetical protein
VFRNHAKAAIADLVAALSNTGSRRWVQTQAITWNNNRYGHFLKCLYLPVQLAELECGIAVAKCTVSKFLLPVELVTWCMVIFLKQMNLFVTLYDIKTPGSSGISSYSTHTVPVSARSIGIPIKRFLLSQAFHCELWRCWIRQYSGHVS